MDKIAVVKIQNKNCFKRPERYNVRKILQLVEERLNMAEDEMKALMEKRDEDLATERDLIDEDENLEILKEDENKIQAKIQRMSRRRNRDEPRILQLQNELEDCQRKQQEYRAGREKNAQEDYENQTIEIRDLEYCQKFLKNWRTKLAAIIPSLDMEWVRLRTLSDEQLLDVLFEEPEKVLLSCRNIRKIRPAVRLWRKQITRPLEVTVKFADDHIQTATYKAIHRDVVVMRGFTVDDVEKRIPNGGTLKERAISLILNTENFNILKVIDLYNLIKFTTIEKLQVSSTPDWILTSFLKHWEIGELVLGKTCNITGDMDFPTLRSLTPAEYTTISAQSLSFLRSNKELEVLEIQLTDDRQEGEIEGMILEWVDGRRKIEKWILSKNSFLNTSTATIRRQNRDRSYLKVELYETLGKKIFRSVEPIFRFNPV